MTRIIQMNVPRCPKCSAHMIHGTVDDEIIYICNDCHAKFYVRGLGNSEIELIVSDDKEEKHYVEELGEE